MTFLNSIKKALLLVNVIYIAIGYLLLAKGSACVEVVVTILAYGLMLAGIIEIIRYFVTKIDDRYKRNDFILGIVLMALAIVTLICKYSLSDITTVAFGVAIIVSAALKFQDALDAKKIGKNHFGTYLTLMIVCIAMGVLVIINFFYILNYKLLYATAGIGMLFAGISDLVSNIYLSILKTKYELAKSKEETAQETKNEEPVKEETTEETVEAKFTPIDADKPKEDLNNKEDVTNN